MNHISVIASYKHRGNWVFDDLRVGLVREPFICEDDKIIDRITEGVPNADNGFTMIFSAQPFPGYQHRFVLRRPQDFRTVDASPERESEGWHCPALLRYFASPPGELYVEVRS